MVELDQPVIYGLGISGDGRGYSLMRCGAPLKMDGTYMTDENSSSGDSDRYPTFISRVLDDIGSIPCKIDDLAEDELCPNSADLKAILNATSFEFTGDKHHHGLSKNLRSGPDRPQH